MAKIIDGKSFAEGLRGRIAKAVAVLKSQHGFTPGLAVVLVGDDPASRVYVANKAKQTVEVGMNSWEHKFPAETSEADLLAMVEKLNNDPGVHGILVQLPLPKHIDSTKVLSAISPAKDVDGFHVVNVGKLSTGQDSLVPCTPVGSVMLAKDVLGSLARSTGWRPWSSDAPTSSASPWRSCCSPRIAPSPSRIRRRRISPPWCAAPISSSPPWAVPRWSRETG